MTNEQVAELFHETYERLAPKYDYVTRISSAVPWKDVPTNSRNLMIATIEEIRQMLCSEDAQITETGGMTMSKLIFVKSCADCPYSRVLWIQSRCKHPDISEAFMPTSEHIEASTIHPDCPLTDDITGKMSALVVELCADSFPPDFDECWEAHGDDGDLCWEEDGTGRRGRCTPGSDGYNEKVQEVWDDLGDYEKAELIISHLETTGRTLDT